jgi:hypothetical protein
LLIIDLEKKLVHWQIDKKAKVSDSLSMEGTGKSDKPKE